MGDGMVQIPKLPLGSSGKHINLFGDALKRLFEAVEELVNVTLFHIEKYSMAATEEPASSLDHLVGKHE